MTDIWEDEFDDGDFVSLKLGFEFITAGAFDELELGPLLDEAAGQTVSPVVKAICMLLLSRQQDYALCDPAECTEFLPCKALLGSQFSPDNLSDKSLCRTLDKLGRLNLEALYSKCAQRALQTAQACTGSADREKSQVIFFASGALSLFEASDEEGFNSEPRLFNFNALLDGQSKIPREICFAELFGQEALETVRSNGAKASKLVTEQRRAALITMLERQQLSGSVLELPKALDSKEVQAAAQSAGVAVVQRKAGSAALVHKPSSWSLWELISVHYIYCAAEFLENKERERAVCFILALSLMLWYFLDAKVRAACAKLQITDLKAEFFKKPSAKVKESAADKKKSAGIKIFHSLVTLSEPSVMEVPQGSTTALKVDGLPPAAAAIVNELGPCYQRYLTAEACSGKKC